MQRISLLETAHLAVRNYLSTGSIALDATVGNGHDTLFLAKTVGESGHIYGFDIQAAAIAATRQRLQENGFSQSVTLYEASHAEMLKFIPAHAQGQIQAIMFNLGYLPGADKSLITQTSSTLSALDSALQILAHPGIISIMAYPGHVGGDRECAAIAAWCADKSTQSAYQIQTHASSHAQFSAPRLFLIHKN
jgi:SAM-dependent methyltransferase